MKDKTMYMKNLINGAPEGIRTPGPLIRSQVLYPAELRVQWLRFTWPIATWQEPILNF